MDQARIDSLAIGAWILGIGGAAASTQREDPSVATPDRGK
jgi:hypothetical protein